MCVSKGAGDGGEVKGRRQRVRFPQIQSVMLRDPNCSVYLEMYLVFK